MAISLGILTQHFQTNPCAEIFLGWVTRPYTKGQLSMTRTDALANFLAVAAASLFYGTELQMALNREPKQASRAKEKDFE